jgi:hypothetical protein
MGRGLGIKERSSLTIANIESSFHEQSLTIPPAKLVDFGNCYNVSAQVGIEDIALVWVGYGYLGCECHSLPAERPGSAGEKGVRLFGAFLLGNNRKKRLTNDRGILPKSQVF